LTRPTRLIPDPHTPATTASTTPASSPSAWPANPRHIGIGRTHARTHIIRLIDDLHIRVVNAATGELLRELDLDPTRDYQPTGPQPKRP
jgi:hypothetical protein